MKCIPEKSYIARPKEETPENAVLHGNRENEMSSEHRLIGRNFMKCVSVYLLLNTDDLANGDHPKRCIFYVTRSMPVVILESVNESKCFTPFYSRLLKKSILMA